MKLFGKIGRRLLAWFLLIALIPVLFTGYQGYVSARTAVEREVFLHMEAIATAKHRAIDQWFQERRADLRVLASLPAPVLASTPPDAVALDAVARVMMTFVDQSRSFSQLTLYDKAGRELLSTAGAGPRLTASARSPLFREALVKRQSVASPIFLDAVAGPSMLMAEAVRDSLDRPHGVLIGALALAQTLNPVILDTTGLGQTGQAYLVDKGKVMLTPSRFMDHPGPLTHTMDSEGIRQALEGHNGAGVYTGFEGQPVLGAWVYLPEQEWGLISEMNADEAFSPLARLRRNAVLVALLTMAAVMVVVAWISRSISLPIRQLAAASLDVSRGNLDSTVTIRLNDELGELGERFNGMVQSLRESQKQLVQSERLAAIGELAASVVHEIRNPLSAVKMNLRILETRCATDPVTAEHFRLARTQTERLESMLTELLDYSKPVTLQRRAVAVADLIRDALAHFAEPVEIRLAEPLPLVNVDPERLTQVLLNLLLNAKQAGGSITISAAAEDTTVRLTVADTGHGISADNLKRVFEPFFTTRKQGTGLGLPNARKIVEAHGGTIRITSTADTGTQAEIAIPV